MAVGIAGDKTMVLAKVLMALGSAFSLFSVKMTFRHSLMPSFEAPGYDKGRKHTRYHALRGGTLAVGALAVLNMVVHAPERDRNPTLWNAAAVTSLGYFGGWWMPKPYLGLKTPSWMAEAIHLGAAGFSVLSLVLARSSFQRS
mmetsp:Transcript_80038/g.185870  ORF Transcript_80038/g.185870 Transcript_80038/m.185870 type:complete len:143 (-) Transcript_80038:90-518(-)